GIFAWAMSQVSLPYVNLSFPTLRTDGRPHLSSRTQPQPLSYLPPGGPHPVQTARTGAYRGFHMAASTAPTVMPGCSATPSWAAAWATARATRAEVARRSSMGGRREAPGVLVSVSPATARAATVIMWSVMRRARDRSAPRPRPGKIRALLAWPIWWVTP